MTEGWRDHTGNGFPPLNPATLVFVEFRDGHRTSAAEPIAHWYPNWYWSRSCPGDSEIVAYKVVK